MKTVLSALVLVMATVAWVRPVWGQTEAHYNLGSANEVIHGEQYTVTLMAWERHRVEITVHKPLNVPAEISVRTAERELISNEQIDRSLAQFRRILNVKELSPGSYWLDIRIGKITHRRELRIASTEAAYRIVTLKE